MESRGCGFTYTKDVICFLPVTGNEVWLWMLPICNQLLLSSFFFSSPFPGCQQHRMMMKSQVNKEVSTSASEDSYHVVHAHVEIHPPPADAVTTVANTTLSSNNETDPSMSSNSVLSTDNHTHNNVQFPSPANVRHPGQPPSLLSQRQLRPPIFTVGQPAQVTRLDMDNDSLFPTNSTETVSHRSTSMIE